MMANLWHGDCLEVMRTLPDESYRLCVTSPPYNLRNNVGGFLVMKGDLSKKYIWSGAKLRDGFDEHPDDMPHDEYVAWQRQCLTEMMRLLREDGAIYYNHQWRTQRGLHQGREENVDGFPVRQIIIWDRGVGINVNDTYFLPTYQVIYLIAKPKYRLAKGACGMGNVWRFGPDYNNEHPAPYPVELPYRCITAGGGGPVLDPFMGSGTTALAAMMAGEEWDGIEKSAAYVSMARQRLDSWRSEQLPLV